MSREERLRRGPCAETQVTIDRPFRGRLAPEWMHVPIAILLLMAAVVAVTLSQSQENRTFRGQNDFLILYSGARLVGSGDLYSPEAIKRVQQSSAGVWLQGVYYSRLPFYAALLKPLAAFPYLSAYWIFQSINLACFAVIIRFFFVRRHPSYLTWLPNKEKHRHYRYLLVTGSPFVM